MKLTPWFDGSVKPVRVGVYQRLGFDDIVWYTRWNGQYWCFLESTPELANKTQRRSMYQDIPWRGILK